MDSNIEGSMLGFSSFFTDGTADGNLYCLLLGA